MTETRPLRVGDAERDTAVTALSEHYAAGRLTKDEFDERSGQAWSARYAADLDGLFADLPQPRGPIDARPARTEPAAPPWSGRREPGTRRPPRPRLFAVIPLKIAAVGGLIFLIASTAPWMFFVLIPLMLFGGMGAGHRRAQLRQERWRERYGYAGGPAMASFQGPARPQGSCSSGRHR